MQHVDGVVDVAAHVHVPGDHVAGQQGDGRARGHHELVRLAVGDLVEQWRVEEDVAGQEVGNIQAQQDVDGNAPSPGQVMYGRRRRGHEPLEQRGPPHYCEVTGGSM